MKILDTLKSRVTGLGAFGLSVSWEYQESEAEVIRSLFLDFENHRVLFDRGCGSDRTAMIESVEKIREDITNALKKLPNNSEAITNLKALRAECQATQGRIELHNVSQNKSYYQGPEEDFFFELGQFRGVFGVHLALLAQAFRVDIGEQFEHILPAPIKNV
ncbi:hypothetical protein EXU34_17535 [Alteromonas sp. ZYF713]|nr:hypothetical protein [Alteromonas sp. ZYF713]